MSNDKIKSLLKNLAQDMKTTDLDADTLSMIEAFDADIHDLLNPDTASSDHDSVIEDAKLLEARFAAEHPVADRFIREFIETLGRIGV